jgi:hypothetical protein
LIEATVVPGRAGKLERMRKGTMKWLIVLGTARTNSMESPPLEERELFEN